jgi:hypothetical protein
MTCGFPPSKRSKSCNVTIKSELHRRSTLWSAVTRHRFCDVLNWKIAFEIEKIQ